MATSSHGSTPEVDDRDIPCGRQVGGLVDLTPVSVVVDVQVNSPVGSGLMVYPDFETAVRDTWAMGLEIAFESYDDKRRGRELPAELREGRRAYRALLDRYEREGYLPDMADEADTLSSKYGYGYFVHVIAALPQDLDYVLSMAYPDHEDDEALVGAPARVDFNLDNPDHLAWLQGRLERLVE